MKLTLFNASLKRLLDVTMIGFLSIFALWLCSIVKVKVNSHCPRIYWWTIHDFVLTVLPIRHSNTSQSGSTRSAARNISVRWSSRTSGLPHSSNRNTSHFSSSTYARWQKKTRSQQPFTAYLPDSRQFFHPFLLSKINCPL